MLSTAQRCRAVEFVRYAGRPLDNARLDYHLAGGSAERVLQALAGFQNLDGGFGHALEQDILLPDSSAIATSVALQLLLELDTPADHPLLVNALTYLARSRRTDTGWWDTVPSSVSQHPHAPWWAPADTANAATATGRAAARHA